VVAFGGMEVWYGAVSGIVSGVVYPTSDVFFLVGLDDGVPHFWFLLSFLSLT
jgi:hypothetical protein